MNPEVATGLSVEVILKLISLVGVGNFIAIVVVLALIVNFPNIISSINNSIKNKNYASKIEEIKQNIAILKSLITSEEDKFSKLSTLVNNQSNEIKSLIAIIDILHASLEKENSERRDEHLMLTESLEKVSKALESISMILRNVISEDDTLKLLNFSLGIEPSLKNAIIEKSMEAVESIEAGINNGSIEENLKNDLHSVWSDFKNKISSFNTPVNIGVLLEDKDSELWAENGMFAEILRLTKMSRDEVDKARKKDAIVKRVNVGLRRIYSDLSNFLIKRRQNNVRK